MAASKIFRIALVQMKVVQDKMNNLKSAVKLISNAHSEGSTLIVLPECFNSPYGTKYFADYAEEVPGGETSTVLSKAAKEYEVFIIGGSIPEREGPKLFNTSTVWNPKGELVAKYRKVHLFDIDVPGKIKFLESEVLSAGNTLTTFDVNGCKIGLGICYDLRFNELASIYRQKDCHMIIYPGAFNTTTGPLHWELLLRGRAVDNQVFVAGVCSAQDQNADYVAWGHTMIINPWGRILSEAEFKETILYADIDIRECTQFRQQVPTYKQRRSDIYEVVHKTK